MDDCLTLIASERVVISTGIGQQPIPPRVRRWNDKHTPVTFMLTLQVNSKLLFTSQDSKAFICDGTRHQKSHKFKLWNKSFKYNLYNMKPS